MDVMSELPEPAWRNAARPPRAAVPGTNPPEGQGCRPGLSTASPQLNTLLLLQPEAGEKQAPVC